MMSNSMQRSSSSASALITKCMWTVSPLPVDYTAEQNADRLFVNVKEHNADVLFRVCTSVVPAENWGCAYTLERVHVIP